MHKPDDNPENRYLFLAAQGDKQAFGMLYSQYLDEIYRFVFFKVESKQTAEDITEETFVKAWKNLPKIIKKDGRIKNFRAWLYRIANNSVIDYYRKKKPVGELSDSRPNNMLLPEEVVIKQENSHQLTLSVKELEPDFQEIIILRMVNQLSHKEVASIMNISESHSRVLLYRALKKLKEILVKKEGKYA